jgi:hypothetical protein
MANGLLAKNGIIVTGSVEVQNAVTASAFSGNGSALTNTPQTDISALNTFTSSIQSEVNTLTAATSSYITESVSISHLATTSSVDVLTAATSSYLTSIPNTYLNTDVFTTETISKNFSYTSSLNVAEITSSVESVIMDYRLTNLNNGSRAGTFIYTHNGTDLNYVDISVEGVGVGNNPILSATLTGSIVSLDIENAAGFNFSGFAKKFGKLGSAVPIPDPNASYLLDDYPGAVAAYSLRALRDPNVEYTGSCVRVREDGSNTELDIGFGINGNLNTTTLASHCGSNNGYVTKWYDQSGNGRDATQTTSGLQPQIYNGTSAITTNNKPTIKFDSSILNGPGLDIPDITLNLSDFTAFVVSKFSSTSHREGKIIIFNADGTSADYRYNQFAISRPDFWISTPTVKASQNGLSHTVSLNDQRINVINGTNGYINGVSIGTFNTPGNNSNITGINHFIGGDIGRDRGLDGDIQEYILYNIESSNRTDIETNINNHYSIYNAGLLANYPGATAAYSIRRLTTTFTSSMNIRRASDNAEQVIGFTSAGDLDTGSIETFCAGTECYVGTWYDQSGNGNDAAQTNASHQPQIYNGTSIITEGGKAALQFDQQLHFDLSVVSSSQPLSISTVYKNPDTSVNAKYTTLFSGGGSYFAGTLSNSLNFGTPLNHTRNDGLYMNLFLSVNGVNSKIIKNTILDASGDAGLNDLQMILLGGQGSYNTYVDTMQEFIVWSSDQSGSGNMPGIETDINSYFNIY